MTRPSLRYGAFAHTAAMLVLWPSVGLADCGTLDSDPFGIAPH
jgi:hypothetical protein